MFSKKKIVLNSAVNDNKKGVVELTQLDIITHIKIKINGTKYDPQNQYIFLLKNNCIQQKFIIKNPNYYIGEVGIPIDFSKKISCLLIENGLQQIPIFWGGTDVNEDFTQMQQALTMEQNNALPNDSINTTENQTNSPNEQINQYNYQDDLTEKTPTLDRTNLQNTTASNNLLSNQEPDEKENLFTSPDIESEIDCAMKYELIDDYKEYDLPQCAHCKYKDIFFKEQHLLEAKTELEKISQIQAKEDYATIIKDDIENNDGSLLDDEQTNNNFLQNKSIPYYYSLIQNQYEEMFQKYPIFEKLSLIIDNSKWIKIDNIEDPYIMGIIYNDNIPQYLCYGVIQEKKSSPPIEINDSSQWVPFDIHNEYGQGAYIMYQSAENGETLKIEVC